MRPDTRNVALVLFLTTSALSLSSCVTDRSRRSDVATASLSGASIDPRSSSSSRREFAVRVERDRIYGIHAREELLADLYFPIATPEQRGAELAADFEDKGKRRPAIIVIHGGGWYKGSRSDMGSIARRLATAGFVVVNISYRLAPAYQFPAQVIDVREAIRWTRREAVRLGVDPERIGLFGYSAGAHLALMAALPTSFAALNGAPDLTTDVHGVESDPYSAQLDGVQAVVAGGAPTNLMEFDSSEIFTKFLGGPKEEKPDVWLRASPITWIRRGAPPMFIYHGKNDWVVPVHQSRMLVDGLRRLDNRVEYHELTLGHVVNFLFDDETVDHAIAFLIEHLND